MTVVDWTQLFRNHRTFRRLNETEVARLLDPQGSGERSYTAGEPIIRQGESGDTLFFLGKGAASVSITGPDGQELALATLASGDFFGELTLLGDRARSATVKASGDCVALEVKASMFLEVLHQHPDIFSEMLLVLSERLRRLAERVITVAYDEVNDRMGLFGAKLDAELKAMNASLTASQTVFEQTAARAHEVITSTEKVWSRFTMFGSAVAAGGSIIVAFLGWLGFTSFNEIKNRADATIQSVVTKAEGVNKIAADVEQQAADIDKRAQRIKGLEETFISGGAWVLLPQLLDNLIADSSNGANSIPTAKKLFGMVMQSQDMWATSRVFNEIYKNMLRTFVQGDQGKVTRDYYRNILRDAVDHSNDWNINARDVALSYYLILASLIIDDRLNEYKETLAKLEYYSQKREKPLITETDQQAYDPSLFEASIDILVGANNIEATRARDMKRKIRAIWGQITKS